MEERFSQNFNKLYYSIGEVAELLGVNASLIRFWEKEFDAIKPKKNAKGNRKFTPKDIETLKRIYDLVKVKGYTLEGAKKELTLTRNMKTTLPEISSAVQGFDVEIIRQKLRQVQSKLMALKL